jgi:hypothetical protein
MAAGLIFLQINPSCFFWNKENFLVLVANLLIHGVHVLPKAHFLQFHFLSFPNFITPSLCAAYQDIVYWDMNW